ncbi:MAG: hypothetical protein ACYDBB_27230, partial [Armatimonadota bacterium]
LALFGSMARAAPHLPDFPATTDRKARRDPVEVSHCRLYHCTGDQPSTLQRGSRRPSKQCWPPTEIP